MKRKMCRRWHGAGAGLLRMTMGIVVFLLVASITILTLPAKSGAGDWPERPITIIVPWPPGSSTDLCPRLLAPKLSEILGVAVNVVNKPGGGGIPGTLEGVKAKPDGYTLFIETAATPIMFASGRKIPFKFEERTHISKFIFNPLGLIVPTSKGWKTIQDFIDDARANPSSISFGLTGGGMGNIDVTSKQFLFALKKKGVDISKIRPVSYIGSGEILPAVAGGHISFTFISPFGGNPIISAGKAHFLAVNTPYRWKVCPDVPTMAEVGLPSVTKSFWVGVCGPPGLPADITKTLDDAVRETLAKPEMIARLQNLGVEPDYKSTDKYREFVAKEMIEVDALLKTMK